MSTHQSCTRRIRFLPFWPQALDLQPELRREHRSLRSRLQRRQRRGREESGDQVAGKHAFLAPCRLKAKLTRLLNKSAETTSFGLGACVMRQASSIPKDLTSASPVAKAL